MTRTFWLSFCDPHKPKGESFLGVCVVDVTDADAARARLKIRRLFPDALPGAEWIAAATTKAHREGCNPSGEVAGFDISLSEKLTDSFPPRNQLLSRLDLETLELT